MYQKPGSNLANNNSYNESLNYDKYGNITDLVRYGGFETDGSYPTVLIDQLSYSYKPNSNQLQSVYDSSVNPEGFNDRNLTLTDYDYDANGNMNIDNNKQIQSITYNHLNLPTKITFATTGTIEYLYNAIGLKVSKKVFDTGTNLTTITDYLSGYQYKNNVLQFFSTAEGYVNFTASLQKGGTDSYNYVFNYTDHLGNIRLSYSQDPSTNVHKIIEENHYYPFGLKHSGYNAEHLVYAKNSSDVLRLRPVPPLFATSYNYKYNGKELQDELSLNLFDYGAMMYDPAIGRRNNIDPYAELNRRTSPYSYAKNNPLRFIDPDGMIAKDVIDEMVKKSDNDKETKWTFKDNGTATSNNGNSVNVNDENTENASSESNSSGNNIEAGSDGGKKGGKGGKGGNGGKPSYTPPPKDLPDGAERLKPKGGRPRYRLPDGDIIEWDGQHGEWERYNPRGKHTGVLSPDGELIKDPVPGRRIEPIVQITVNTAATLTAGYIIYKIIVAAATWECFGCGLLITP